MILDDQPGLNLLFKILNKNNSLEELLQGLTSEDWTLVVHSAREHGLGLLLYQRLSQAKGLIPVSIYKHLRELFLRATARNMVMQHHAGNVLRNLRDRELEVIVLKGLYLAESVYSAIGARTFGDIDLLLRRAELPVALEVMRSIGYEISTWYDPDDPNRDIKHLPPLVKQGSPIIELHWTILEEEEPFSIDVEGMWARSVAAEIAGVAVRGLSLEDFILHLSMHLTYQHRLAAGVRNLYDIDAVIRKGGVDWTRLLTTAREWGAERVIWLTLRLLQEIAGTPLPSEVFGELLPQQPDPVIVDEAWRQLLDHGSGDVALTPDLAALGETKGACRKIRLAFERVFIRKRVLAREYNVDPRSIWIYGFYLVRAINLVRSYSGSVMAIMRKDQDFQVIALEEHLRAKVNDWLKEN
jgi:hypothetical protein